MDKAEGRMGIMETALIVTGTEAGVRALFDLLHDFRLRDIQFATNGGEARRRLAAQEYDLAIVNTPLRDEFGADLACHIAETTTTGVILLVKEHCAEQIGEKVEPSGVFVLEKPISRTVFRYTMRMMSTMERRLQMLKAENLRLHHKFEQMRLISRAKLVLMQNLKMTEEAAHYHIEHQAMDRRCTKEEIAKAIIRTYQS